MELWDIYDIDRQPTGSTGVRGEKLGCGEYHMVVHLGIINSEGRMLIQRRCLQKATFPGKWDISVGGSALSGETSRQAIHRELLEELGVDIDFSDIRPKLTVNFERGFDDYYLICKDIDLDGLRLQEEEVMDARWADISEIFDLIDRGEFLPFMKSFIQLLFDMKCSPDNLDM
ncbi:MAG: NUDIX domain-containing protein [Oscillospiraceae bacterium]|nr:NUDIX domain-containing protein [Oscillospiraceae bacterium]